MGNNVDKVAIIDATGIIDTGLTGVVAIKVAEDLNSPTLLLQKRDDKTYGGSGRNFDNSPIEDFRTFVESCPYVSAATGHMSAFGVSVPLENVELARQWFNEQLADVNMDKIYLVDFILDADELSVELIYEIDKYDWLWGTGVKEPKIAVENIAIHRSDIHVQGKSFNSISFIYNDIKYVQFNMKEDDPLLEWASAWDGEDGDQIVLNVVGTVGINEYKGVYTPQFIIENSNLTIQN